MDSSLLGNLSVIFWCAKCAVGSEVLSRYVLMCASALHTEKGEVAPVPIRQTGSPYEAELTTAYVVDRVRVEMTADAEGIVFTLSTKVGLPDNVVQALSQWQFRPVREVDARPILGWGPDGASANADRSGR